MSADKITRNLIDILNKELKLLEDYNSSCESLHKHVVAKDWSKLEQLLGKMNKRAEKLNSCDLIREELILHLKEEFELDTRSSFGMLMSRVDEKYQKEIKILKQQLRLALGKLQSRVKGIGNYTESQSAALKDVLDILIPDQKGRIYNNKGTASPVDNKPMLFNHQF